MFTKMISMNKSNINLAVNWKSQTFAQITKQIVFVDKNCITEAYLIICVFAGECVYV